MFYTADGWKLGQVLVTPAYAEDTDRPDAGTGLPELEPGPSMP